MTIVASIFNEKSTLPLTAGCYAQQIKISTAVALGQGVQSKPVEPQQAITNIVRLTQAQYNAIAVKHPATLYLVTS